MIDFKKNKKAFLYNAEGFEYHKLLTIEDYDSNSATFSFIAPSELAQINGRLSSGAVLFLMDVFTSLSVNFTDPENITDLSVSIKLEYDAVCDLTAYKKYNIECNVTKHTIRNTKIVFKIFDEDGKLTGSGLHLKRQIRHKF